MFTINRFDPTKESNSLNSNNSQKKAHVKNKQPETGKNNINSIINNKRNIHQNEEYLSEPQFKKSTNTSTERIGNASEKSKISSSPSKISRWGPKVAVDSPKINIDSETKTSSSSIENFVDMAKTNVVVENVKDISIQSKIGKESYDQSDPSSDTSSSVPFSSDEDEDEDEDDGNSTQVLHQQTKDDNKIVAGKKKSRTIISVIAPEQKISQTKRPKLTDEAMDDFDIAIQNENLVSSFPPSSTLISHQSQLQTKQIKHALYLSQLPISQVGKLWNLPSFLISNILNHPNYKYKTFFPIQCLIIPDILSSSIPYNNIANGTTNPSSNNYETIRDVCVSSPTGSGKTLSFVVPVITALHKRNIIRLRALVISPSRDLCIQIYNVFKDLSQDSDLRIGLLVGGNGHSDFNEDNEYDNLILNNGGGRSNFDNSKRDSSFRTKHSHDTTNIPRSDNDYEKILKYAFHPTNVQHAFQAFHRTQLYNHQDTNAESTCHSSASQLLSSSLSGLLTSTTSNTSSSSNFRYTPRSGKSAIDILVCTPGKLMKHLQTKSTSGFTLQHLKYLIIDEADRLVNQRYQNWIENVVRESMSGMDALDEEYVQESHVEECFDADISKRNLAPKNSPMEKLDPITWRKRDFHAPCNYDIRSEYEQLNDSSHQKQNGNLPKVKRNKIDSSVCQPIQLRKLLFSATLTKDPQKLSSLGLINPKHYDAHHFTMFNTDDNQSDTVKIKGNTDDAIHYNDEPESSNTRSKLENSIQSYSLPPKLSEYMIECKSEQKPLVLLALLLEQQQSLFHKQGIIAVFTSSIDSTHRLARLLQLLWVGAGYGPSNEIAEFSSNMTQKQRAALIQSCNTAHSSSFNENGSTKPQSRIKIVICSDGMSRGMDIASISTVIHYDIPSYAKTYVHRCGRTARANREGQAISILKVGQKSQFTKMRNLISNPEQVEMMGVKKDLVQDMIPVYQKCVKALRNVMEAEKNEELSPFASVDVNWLK